MPDVDQLFRLATRNARPAPGALARQLEAQRRRTRNRKMRALAVAASITTAIVALLASNALDRGKEGSAPGGIRPTGSGLSLTVVGLDGLVRSSTALPAGAMTPAISPDGTRVAFVVVRAGISQIATMQLDGQDRHIITNDPMSAVRPRWSPDGKRLVFYREEASSILHLMVMDADGTNVHEIRGTRIPDNLPADWSPDGSLFLYTSMIGFRDDDLATIPTTGGPSHLLAPTNHVDEAGGAWSPDGRTIAFKRLVHPRVPDAGLRWEIWLMNADGSGQHRLAKLPHANAEAPAWSPDGSQVAFIGSGMGYQHGGVFVVDVASGELHEVLGAIALGAVGQTIDQRATWLPSGDALVVMTGMP